MSCRGELCSKIGRRARRLCVRQRPRLKLYEELAKEIEGQIRRGVFRPGDRVPSVRQTSQHRQISITTVLRAYLMLESKGVIQSRPQSGYFVRLGANDAAPRVQELDVSKPIAVSAQVDVSRLVLSTLRSIGSDEAVPLGSPYPEIGRAHV